MKLTTQVADAAAERIKAGDTIRMACIAAKVSERSFFRWHKLGKEILEKQDEDIELVMSTNEDAYLNFYLKVEVAHAFYCRSLLDELKKPDAKAWQKICWELERRYPKDFGRFGQSLTELKPAYEDDDAPARPDQDKDEMAEVRARIRNAHGVPKV